MHEGRMSQAELENENRARSVIVGNQRRNVLSARGIVSEDNRSVRNIDDDFFEPVRVEPIEPIVAELEAPNIIPPAVQKNEKEDLV
jgi:hypothetical protein